MKLKLKRGGTESLLSFSLSICYTYNFSYLDPAIGYSAVNSTVDHLEYWFSSGVSFHFNGDEESSSTEIDHGMGTLGPIIGSITATTTTWVSKTWIDTALGSDGLLLLHPTFTHTDSGSAGVTYSTEGTGSGPIGNGESFTGTVSVGGNGSVQFNALTSSYEESGSYEEFGSGVGYYNVNGNETYNGNYGYGPVSGTNSLADSGGASQAFFSYGDQYIGSLGNPMGVSISNHRGSTYDTFLLQGNDAYQGSYSNASGGITSAIGAENYFDYATTSEETTDSLSQDNGPGLDGAYTDSGSDLKKSSTNFGVAGTVKKSVLTANPTTGETDQSNDSDVYARSVQASVTSGYSYPGSSYSAIVPGGFSTPSVQASGTYVSFDSGSAQSISHDWTSNSDTETTIDPTTGDVSLWSEFDAGSQNSGISSGYSDSLSTSYNTTTNSTNNTSVTSHTDYGTTLTTSTDVGSDTSSESSADGLTTSASSDTFTDQSSSASLYSDQNSSGTFGSGSSFSTSYASSHTASGWDADTSTDQGNDTSSEQSSDGLSSSSDTGTTTSGETSGDQYSVVDIAGTTYSGGVYVSTLITSAPGRAATPRLTRRPTRPPKRTASEVCRRAKPRPTRTPTRTRPAIGTGIRIPAA